MVAKRESHVSRRELLRNVGGGAGILFVGGGTASLLSACGGSAQGSSGGGGNQLAFGLNTEPDSLDPATMRLLTSYQVVNSIYDQLLWKVAGQPTDKFLPGLATSYSISSDGKTYTFKLRKGVTFHDGTPFNADAVKATFDRIVAPATKSISAKAVLGPYKSSTVVDSHTVKVGFTAVNGGFLDNVASPLLSVVSPTAARKGGAEFGRHPVGTGPFKFSSWTPGQSIDLVRNEKYGWGPDAEGLKGPAKLSNVTFRIVTSSPAQANALQSGVLQVAQGMDPPDVVRLTKAGFPRHVVDASGAVFGFVLNVQKAPTNDLRVRQAIEYATNVKEINSTVFDNFYSPANTVLTSAMVGHSNKISYSYDPAHAGAILDQAGWKMGSGGVRSKNGTPLHLSWLIESGGFGFEQGAELMVAQLNKVGISSTISQLATDQYEEAIGKGAMNVSGLYDYAADPYILNTLYSCAEIGDGPNDAHYCNKQTDAQITAANGTANARARSAAYKKIENKLMQEALNVPIYNLAAIFVTAKPVSGIAYTAFTTPLLTNASV